MKTRACLITKTALLVTLLFALGASGSAHATAFADVDAGWAVQFNNAGSPTTAFPSGFSFSCMGDAVSAGTDACSDTASLKVNSGNGSSFAETFTGGFTITNNTNQALSYALNFDTAYSAFLPGSGGAWVDDKLNELASFSSAITGPNTFDKHSCTTSVVVSSCTVQGADISDGFFFLTSLGAGDTYTADFTITLDATLKGEAAAPVPEPASIAFVAAGLFMLLFSWRAARR
jgi:hypothetical protein